MITVYGNLVNPKNLAAVNPKNKWLQDAFLRYLAAKNRRKKTIEQYRHGLNLFFVWNLIHNDNKEFVKITKEDFIRYQETGVNDWGWAAPIAYLRRAALLSLSTFVQDQLDDLKGYSGYKSILAKVDPPHARPSTKNAKVSHEEMERVFNTLIKEGEYKAVCMLSLALFSGRRRSDIAKFKVSYFNDKNVLGGVVYKTPVKITSIGAGGKKDRLYFYVLKEAFDPYLKLWMRYREENGIETQWLFPDYRNTGASVSQCYFSRINRKVEKVLGRSFTWLALRELAKEEFQNANLGKEIIQDMLGWDMNDASLMCSDISASESMEEYFKA